MNLFDTQYDSSLLYDFMEKTYNSIKNIELKVSKKTTNKSAVIIEPRESKNLYLEYAIRNIMFFLGEEWNLYIFHGIQNASFVKEKFEKTNAFLVDLETHDLHIDEYNNLLTSEKFWNQIEGENILIFQEDSLLCRDGIEEFLEYDYVGAPWPIDKIHNNPDLSGGNGGLSLRRKSAILQSLRSYQRAPQIPEDIFFVNALYRLKCNIAPREVCKKFSIERIYHDNPLGMHAPHKWMDESRIIPILDKINYDNLRGVR